MALVTRVVVAALVVIIVIVVLTPPVQDGRMLVVSREVRVSAVTVGIAAFFV